MAEVQQLSGRGVQGLEHCPPLFHFDLTGEELDQVMADTGAFLDRHGLRSAATTAADVTVVISRPGQAWHEGSQEWRPVSGPGGGDGTEAIWHKNYCCFMSGDTIVCHRH